MNTPIQMNIGAVERDTGIGKDTLRVWERRYGFPQPVRDNNGERLYPAEQVERLRLIKRLLDHGHRPGRLLAESEERLLQMIAELTLPPSHAMGAAGATGASRATSAALVEQIIGRIRAHDMLGLRQELSQAIARQGLQRFILDSMAPLNQAIGEAWMRGDIQVFEEHLYSEQVKVLLRQALTTLPMRSDAQPRILLTTVSDELHVLGLLMVECILTLDGAGCISLGTQTPLTDIGQAAIAHRADIVALSFSAAYSTRLITPVLRELRQLLPPAVDLWAGGAGIERMNANLGAAPAGDAGGRLFLLPTLDTALATLHDWQQARAVTPNVC